MTLALVGIVLFAVVDLALTAYVRKASYERGYRHGLQRGFDIALNSSPEAARARLRGVER